jgi:hypothetical protein
MRVAILSNHSTFEKQVLRVLDDNNIKGDIITSIRPQTIEEYDVFILSYNNEIPNIVVVIEQIILLKKVHVIYIHKNYTIGRFYQVVDDAFFHLVNYFSYDIELRLLLKTISKISAFIKQQQDKITDLETRYDVLEKITKAKFILMGNGYTEEQAHRFITRGAMDMRVSKKRFANLIIKNRIDI